jgi:hypothetical protein
MAIPMMVMAAGQAMKGFAQYSSLMDEADNMYAMASNSLIQSSEIKRRSEINKEAFTKDVSKLIGQQQGMYAASGVEVSSGAPLSVMTNTVNKAVERLNMMEREASFTLMMKELEVESMYKKGAQYHQAAMMSIASAGLAGAGQAMGE